MAEASGQPDNTAVRVALWRALHVAIDAPPHVLTDDVGLQLVEPAPGWQDRPDMHPTRTSRNRASIVARARLVEDLVAERAATGVAQYVVLGAGLDTFAQRRPEVAASLKVFEVDQPETQAWKRRRFAEMGWPVGDALQFVAVDFEAGESWRDRLAHAGFDAARPAIISSLGVAVYLSRDSVVAMLRDVASLAAGSTLVLSFMLPIDQIDVEEEAALRGAEHGARASGTPWVSFFTPAEMVAMAREAGFRDVRHVEPAGMEARYFGGRTDGLRPSSAEHVVIATV